MGSPSGSPSCFLREHGSRLLIQYSSSRAHIHDPRDFPQEGERKGCPERTAEEGAFDDLPKGSPEGRDTRGDGQGERMFVVEFGMRRAEFVKMRMESSFGKEEVGILS